MNVHRQKGIHMDLVYDIAKVTHIISFVFMSVPLFNLIVVNERALLGASFKYEVDRYMENIVSHGAPRCFVFQATVLISGILLLIYGPLGIEALWMNWIVLVKTILLFLLAGLLSYIHFGVQPKIETILSNVQPERGAQENIMAELKPLRLRRKRMASLCLFLVLTIIILGVQVYALWDPFLTGVFIVLAGMFSWRNYTLLNRFGWI